MDSAMAIMPNEHNAGFQGKIYTCPFVQFFDQPPEPMDDPVRIHEECSPQPPM